MKTNVGERVADGALAQFNEWRHHDGEQTLVQALGAKGREFLRTLIVNFVNDELGTATANTSVKASAVQAVESDSNRRHVIRCVACPSKVAAHYLAKLPHGQWTFVYGQRSAERFSLEEAREFRKGFTGGRVRRLKKKDALLTDEFQHLSRGWRG